MSLPPRRSIIVNGLRYYLGGHGPTDPADRKGFRGRRWTIRFLDGELLRTDDLMWDYSFKNGSEPDTAIILEGWNVTLEMPRCAWHDAGPFQVFGPVRQ